MLTYVTAFHPARTDIDVASYWSDFQLLVESGVSILLFVDSETPVGVLPSTVRVVRRHFSPPPPGLRLPSLRNEAKDTVPFLWLILDKLACLSEALAYTESPYLAWIDFRIFHVIRDIPRAQDALRSLCPSPKKILAPGCWGPQSSVSLNAVCWRYCGGFLLGPRECFPSAYRRQTELVQQYLPNLTWEVNYWAMMDDAFEWYAADHDDSMLLNVPGYASTKDDTTA